MEESGNKYFIEEIDDSGRRGLNYALVGIHLFFHVLELSIRFSQSVGLNFVRGEHQKSKNQKSKIILGKN